LTEVRFSAGPATAPSGGRGSAASDRAHCERELTTTWKRGDMMAEWWI